MAPYPIPEPNTRRTFLLKVFAGVAVGLFVLMKLVIDPMLAGWDERSLRIAALQEKVSRSRQLLRGEASLRGRWKELAAVSLPADVSDAEALATKAISRWARESGVSLSNLAPDGIELHDDSFRLMLYRITATGNQATLGRFIYEMESDETVAVHVEDCELASQDAQGGRLQLTARITFLQIKDTAQKPAPVRVATPAPAASGKWWRTTPTSPCAS
jgi:hypothetical protein